MDDESELMNKMAEKLELMEYPNAAAGRGGGSDNDSGRVEASRVKCVFYNNVLVCLLRVFWGFDLIEGN